MNFLHERIPEGKKALLLNLDESSICTFMGKSVGNLFAWKGIAQKASRGQQRTYLSYVAIICDDPILQTGLPQFIVANKRTLSERQAVRLRSAGPANIHLLREKSAWVNADILAQIIGALAGALAPYTGTLQPILLFDACRPHVTRSRNSWGSCVCVCVCVWKGVGDRALLRSI